MPKDAQGPQVRARATPVLGVRGRGERLWLPGLWVIVVLRAHTSGGRMGSSQRVSLSPASRVLLCPTRDKCAERREVAGPASRALSHYPELPPPPERARAAPCRRTVRPSRNPSVVCVAERVASLSSNLEGRFLQTGKPGRGERLALNHL